MTSFDDDKQIDFNKLERELDIAVQSDAKYWRENDAKFRALHQKVATYDEFRDIVKASHLKPLEKEDRLTEIKFVQPWNTQAKKREERADHHDGEDLPSGKTYPTSGQTFIREWRKLNKDTSKQYSYLLELGAERLGNIFKPEIGFGLLGEFAKCLNCEFLESDFKLVSEILSHLSTTNRFSLTVQFLSSKEKEDLSSVFKKLRQVLEKCETADTEKMDITVFEQLEKVYEIKK